MKLAFIDYLGQSEASSTPIIEIYDNVAPQTYLEYVNWYQGRYPGPTLLISILLLQGLYEFLIMKINESQSRFLNATANAQQKEVNHQISLPQNP